MSSQLLPPRSRGMSAGGTTPVASRPSFITTSSNLNNALEDEQTYASLMQAAGYPVDKILRGQVCKTEDAFWNVNYPFDQGTRAIQNMQAFFPSLPEVVRNELGKFMELIMRDYVSSWYSLLDTTVSYQEEKAKRAAAASSTAPESRAPRRMVYQMAPHRRAPFMEKLYETLTIVFGNLATRVEHVNVLELALLKWTKVLAHTFKTYRHLRRVRLAKHPEAPLTEIAVTKEFLFAGKLHKAVTFGLDVPALLFADATGKECPVEGISGNGAAQLEDENDVLEARLFDSGILKECELDYNRVVAHRMVRALLPRQDFGSPLVSSLVTEIMAACVLGPIMSCFCPDYLNSWIIAGLDNSENTEASEGTKDGDVVDGMPDILPVSSMPDEQGIEVPAPDSPAEPQAPPRANRDPLLGNENGLQNADSETHMHSEEQKSGAPLDPEALWQASSTLGTGNRKDLVSQLAQVLIDLQDYMDLPEMRQAKLESRQGPAVDWDDAGCRAVILRLVLVLEAALMDGRCTYRVRNENRMLSHDEDDEVNLDDSDRPVEVTLTQYESTTLSQLLMELTSDIEAFEERVATENTLEAEEEQRAPIGGNPLEDSDHQSASDAYKPTAIEQSTIRTLIAAWLHTGQVYRTIMVLMQAHATVLAPYYHSQAFLRSRRNANDFAKVLQVLDGVDILVDTMSIMNSPRLDEVLTSVDGESATELHHVPRSSNQRANLEVEQSIDSSALFSTLNQGSGFLSNTATSRHIDFHRNEAFAASLRSERERRTQSWYSLFEGAVDEGVPIICHSFGATDEDASIHRELHHLARIFYSGTNLVSIRDAARRNSGNHQVQSSPTSSTTSSQISLLTVEMASARRRIEVPDDDSSFLLRAQPRPLNAVGVHRDQRNHDQSFKCFAGTYEEPALSTEHFSGGRYVRYCEFTF